MHNVGKKNYNKKKKNSKNKVAKFNLSSRYGSLGEEAKVDSDSQSIDDLFEQVLGAFQHEATQSSEDSINQLFDSCFESEELSDISSDDDCSDQSFAASNTQISLDNCEQPNNFLIADLTSEPVEDEIVNYESNLGENDNGDLSKSILDSLPKITRSELTIRKKNIGLGNFATVDYAEYQLNGFAQAVAIKIPKEKHESGLIYNNFVREAEIMSTINSDSVVGFHGIIPGSNERPAVSLVMDYMANGSVSSCFRSLALPDVPWVLRIRIASDIANGLNVIHQQGIVHGDLHAGNVLLDKQFKAKLTDFGTSIRLQDFANKETRFGGAFPSMPLEGFEQHVPSTQYDMYGFGKTLHYVATHRRPFTDIDPRLSAYEFTQELKNRVANGEHEAFPGDTPDAYKVLAEQCYVNNPTERPNAVEAMQQLAIEQSSPDKREKNREVIEQFVVRHQSLMLFGTRPVSPTRVQTSSIVSNSGSAAKAFSHDGVENNDQLGTDYTKMAEQDAKSVDADSIQDVTNASLKR